MATDNASRQGRRKPTRRTTRKATLADSHYSKLTRKASGYSQVTSVASTEDSTSPTSEYAATRYETLSREALQRAYGNKVPRRVGSGNVTAIVVAVLVLTLFFGSGFAFWSHRSVDVYVAGTTESIRVDSTLEQLYDRLDITTNPGNYVTVGGNLIEEGTGYPFTASIDGTQLTRKELEDYRIRGGETIEFGDGDDRLEDYEVTYRETQPKLVFEGEWGAVSFVKQWGTVGRQEIRTGSVSGETADGDWVDQPQDCIVVTKNIQPADDQKLVAITFDDGPSVGCTNRCLEILAEHDAKATFFGLSSNVEEHPKLAAKIAAAGSQICNHTNQHLDLVTLGQDDLLSEIGSAHDAIARVTGVDTTIIRPPYGSFDRESWLKSQGTVSVSITWNQDSLDWTLPGVDAIVSNSLADVAPGSIILMHDAGDGCDQTMEALPQIIERLQEYGYTLVTISELLDSDPDVPDEVAGGSATMPEGAAWPTEMA